VFRVERRSPSPDRSPAGGPRPAGSSQPLSAQNPPAPRICAGCEADPRSRHIIILFCNAGPPGLGCQAENKNKKCANFMLRLSLRSIIPNKLRWTFCYISSLIMASTSNEGPDQKPGGSAERFCALDPVKFGFDITRSLCDILKTTGMGS
jgi:hypothetical protein